MSQTAQRAARSVSATHAKPVSQLLATVMILLLHVAVSIGVIALVKTTFDRRLDRTVVDEALASALATARQGNAGDAESRIATIIEQRPQLETALVWGTADYLVVMPHLTRMVSANLSEDKTWQDASSPEKTLCVEAGLRANHLREDAGLWAGGNEVLLRPYAFFAACEMQDFAAIRTLSDSSEPVDLAQLPATALPRSASPLGYLAPIQNGVTVVRGPNEIPVPLRDYYLGAVAFYQGRLDQARQFLAHDWEQTEKRADSAFLLGAIAEANGDKVLAREWYGKALATGVEHLAAAQAYIRLVHQVQRIDATQ